MQDPEDFPDDFRGYRRGRAVAAWQPKQRQRRRREVEEQERRQRYAEAVARAELGRFYWSGELKEATKRRPKQRANGRNGQ